MTRRSKSGTPRTEGRLRSDAAPAQPGSPGELPQRERSTFLEAGRQYISGGLGLRANLVFGSIALMGLLIFLATTLAGPIGEDDGGAAGPTVFATGTPEA